MLSKGLIKANQVMLTESDLRIIDSNQLIAEKLEKIRPGMSTGADTEGFQTGLNAPQVEAIFDQEGEEREEGSLLTRDTEAEAQEPVYTGPSPEELIAEAEAQIEEMKQKAREEIEAMREYTLEEWRQQGYKEGQKRAVEELEKEKTALKTKAAQLEEDYQEKISQLEPAFIETLTGIYEQIFKVDLVDYKPVLLHAISNSIRNIEGGRDFIVHVSRDDYDAVMDARAELTAGLASSSASMEIVEDMTLGPNQCMIETSNGIFDCSIGSQLEELGRRLRLLSYE
ncbi:MAG: FliH/SctL family protein [Lachnospiraceae bacterium]